MEDKVKTIVVGEVVIEEDSEVVTEEDSEVGIVVVEGVTVEDSEVGIVVGEEETVEDSEAVMIVVDIEEEEISEEVLEVVMIVEEELDIIVLVELGEMEKCLGGPEGSANWMPHSERPAEEPGNRRVHHWRGRHACSRLQH